RRDLPPELCAVIDEALDPRPERRPPLSELRAELAAAEPLLDDDEGLAAREPLRWPTPRLPAKLPAATALQRLGAGLAAGSLTLGALTGLGPGPSFSPAATAAVVALTVALLPRAGWLAALIGTCGWLSSPGADRPGTALFLFAVAAPVPLLLPRAGKLWSLPALAPVLGAIGLAPAYVALAGLASTRWRRAGLAAAGLLWLAASEVLTGRRLLFGVPDGALPRAGWEHGLSDAASG